MPYPCPTGPDSIDPPLRGCLPADPVDGLLDRLANHLAPLFVTDPDDLPAARLMAVRTIAAYRPETQADFISIARTVSFSMSALAALGRAASEAMPPPLQLRHWGRATTLSRCADQSERGMEQRRRRQQAVPPSMPQAWAAARAADAAAGAGDLVSAADVLDAAELERGEAAIAAAVAEAMQDYVATCRSAAATDHSKVPPDSPDATLTAAPGEPMQRPAAAPPAADGPHDTRKRDPGPVRSADQRLLLLQQRREMDLVREYAAVNLEPDGLAPGPGLWPGQAKRADEPPFTQLTRDRKTFASAASYAHDRHRERPDHAAGREQHDPP